MSAAETSPSRWTLFRSDMAVLRSLVFKRNDGRDHQGRLESFYSGQAEHYDGFRERMLHGRRELMQSIVWPKDGIWLDLGCGTARNLEYAGPGARDLSQIHFVDLSPSLLSQAQRRLAATREAWQANDSGANASIGKDGSVAANSGTPTLETHLHDVTALPWADASVDLVSFSYSLTMIPDWFAAIREARRVLRPGGKIAVVDFFVSRKHPDAGDVRHRGITRAFWSHWFACDNVFLSPDHLPMLRREFEGERVEQARGKIPYLPLVRAPFYQFVGTKA
ncbi:MAG: class I SAM-dependent methyltransferase [Planctomycetota bacterium]